MSRAERLLELMQLLRQYRYPIKGSELANKLGISLRTLYRDIASLQAQGADISGEAGIGYLLRPGFTLPPLMFNAQELEALSLGANWVAERTDSQLSQSAQSALAKIAAVLSPELRLNLQQSGLLIGPNNCVAPSLADNNPLDSLALIRQAINTQSKLHLDYCDLNNNQSNRTVWPFAIGFFEQVRVMIAWCELRQQIRHFRIDRILSLIQLDTQYSTSRHQLLHDWRKQQNIPIT